MISGNTTNSASDGMVNITLAVAVVSRRSSGARCTSRPNGTALISPISTGSNERRRWTTVSAQAAPGWVIR
ncbi:Uncharacterised protein [Mycobacterium tuberculosis]|nr:Uncharacterised protein [Mycobacterium tuberculosis]CKU62062.1 Uncharacterised protein [Mycobacterium tuberculosis]CNT87383.1 Uncharacterised protein [Mycobacterium tuberculosis]CNV99527.1 Uncharacterised protein [Mycobacterium tuberculosis]